MPVLEREQDRDRREILSWIAGKDFETIDDAIEWLGKEAKDLDVDPHKYLNLIELIVNAVNGYARGRPLGAGLGDIVSEYNCLKDIATADFTMKIRMIVVGLQIRATADAIGAGGAGGYMEMTTAIASRLIERVLFGDNILVEFPWEEILTALKPE